MGGLIAPRPKAQPAPVAPPAPAAAPAPAAPTDKPEQRDAGEVNKIRRGTKKRRSILGGGSPSLKTLLGE